MSDDALKAATGTKAGVYGYCIPDWQEIWLNKSMLPNRIWPILFHEILHAALDSSGLSVTLLKNNSRVEEQLCHALGPILADIFQLRPRSRT